VALSVEPLFHTMAGVLANHAMTWYITKEFGGAGVGVIDSVCVRRVI
jgi:hypothetical protein